MGPHTSTIGRRGPNVRSRSHPDQVFVVPDTAQTRLKYGRELALMPAWSIFGSIIVAAFCRLSA